MTKIRLIPVLFLKNGFFVRSEKFSEHKIIGNVVNIVRRFNEWDIDELIVIDISKNNNHATIREDHKVPKLDNLNDVLNLISKECFMPLTFGGGIKSEKQARNLFENGADKILINSLMYEAPDIIKRLTDSYGSQAVVFSLDYRVEENKPVFYYNNGLKKSNQDLKKLKELISWSNVGEILIHCIDRDGTAIGYDLENLKNFTNNFNLPIICCGGAINYYDFFDVISFFPDISGIAAGNMFHFTENIYPRSKKFLKSKKLNVR